MTLTTHAIVGAAIGTLTANPIGGFLLGVGSHFVLDAIPHGHYPLISFLRSDDPRRPYSGRALIAIVIDGVLAFTLAASIFYRFAPLPALLCAIVGAVLPDLLLGIQTYFPSRVAATLESFHHWFHFFFIPERSWHFPMPLVIATELSAIALSFSRLL